MIVCVCSLMHLQSTRQMSATSHEQLRQNQQGATWIIWLIVSVLALYHSSSSAMLDHIAVYSCSYYYDCWYLLLLLLFFYYLHYFV